MIDKPTFKLFIILTSVVLQQILDKIKKKEKRDRQKSDKIKLPHKYKSERKPISHEQYNTRYNI